MYVLNVNSQHLNTTKSKLMVFNIKYTILCASVPMKLDRNSKIKHHEKFQKFTDKQINCKTPIFQNLTSKNVRQNT